MYYSPFLLVMKQVHFFKTRIYWIQNQNLMWMTQISPMVLEWTNIQAESNVPKRRGEIQTQREEESL